MLVRILLAVAALAAPLAQSSAPVSAQRNAPAIDTRVADEMLALARVGSDDVVYDVGSIAAIPIAAARRFGARAVGVGLDPEQAARARASARESGLDQQVRFLDGELLTAKYAEATAVTLDLTPNLNLLLEPILRRDLRPG